MNSCTGDEELGKEEELPKLPFKRLKYALKQIVDVAIPLHVQQLKQQNENIETFQKENRVVELRSEQIKATKTVQLLKSDLYELENLNRQVKDEDSDLFHSSIKDATKDVIEILSLFMDLHSDIFSPLPETEIEVTENTFPPLIVNYDEQFCNAEEIALAKEVANLEQEQVQIVKSKFESFSFLQKELLEVNALIKQFSRFVFGQRESIDTIQDNIEQTGSNVFIGTHYLKKASDYKAASFPLAGAVIGGLILGPAGALAGFKIAGSIACLAGGSIIGYGAGVKLKQKQQAFNEFEMKSITYPSKSQSESSPDVSAAPLEENPVIKAGDVTNCKCNSCDKKDSAFTDETYINVHSPPENVFVLVLDCHKIMVENVEEVNITSSDQEKFKYAQYRPSSFCSKGKLNFVTDKWSLKIWKRTSTCKFCFPQFIRISYKTLPEGPSLLWVTDQDKK